MGGDGTRALDQTPTWAVAAVCAVIVAASILLEGFLHHLGQLLNKKRKKALFDALEKVKSELMTLGFISLLLTVTGRYIARICIPEGAANTMLPCRLSGHSVAEEPKGHGRRHLSEDPTNLFSCRKGMVSLVSADGMHQLHIFVFFLAVFHVTFSFFTMSLGRAKAHLSPGTRFNFRKYIKRSLEDDFKTVVGISPPLWASALAVMLFNVHGWHNLFWFSAIPLVVILAVGTKLQAIIAMMAIEIAERHTVIQGMPVNAFEITYFFWIWYEFGLRSCFHDNFEFIIARVCLGAIVQFMCSYITLPLYALVSQMGSEMKRTIFDEQTAKALKKWHKAVVKKKHHKDSSHNSSETPSTDTTGPAGEAGEWQRLHEVPVRHLHRYKTIAHVGGVRSPLSDPDYSDTDDTEPLSLQTRHLIPPAKQRSLDTERAEVRVNVVETAAAPSDVLQDSFSFPRLLPPRHVPDK
ncbi:barley mlo defense gene homolog2 [Zea mays]|uniref:MLO-like protein n=1 Tax=Zea mays TaxID=4577 RepID=A0A1D6K7P2_MAIZE|nr:barley mlo defense gene homolog2 [Zea mays]